MSFDVLTDGPDEFAYALERAAPDTFFGEVSEPALDEIKPRTGGGREVEMEARMLFEPRLNVGMLVGGVVVADEMEVFVPGRFAVDLAQELQPLGVAVALGTARDD